jgi:hypothetical protein
MPPILVGGCRDPEKRRANTTSRTAAHPQRPTISQKPTSTQQMPPRHSLGPDTGARVFEDIVFALMKLAGSIPRVENPA